MLVVRSIYNFFHHHLIENMDPRLSDLFLVNSPWSIFVIVAAYIYFVNGAGQRWMKHRNPFELTKIINFYNIFQVIANFYVFIKVIQYGSKLESHEIFCVPFPKNDFSLQAERILHVTHVYFLLKVIDLMDTVFFILRKKNNQVTFLHTYHHAGMVVVVFVYFVVTSGGGYGTILGLLNSIVHCAMYFYYFLTSYSPQVKKSLWWKKNITQLQLAQFVLLFLYCFTSIFFVDCNETKFFLWFGMLQTVVMMAMFGDFYYKAYIKRKPST